VRGSILKLGAFPGHKELLLGSGVFWLIMVPSKEGLPHPGSGMKGASVGRSFVSPWIDGAGVSSGGRHELTKHSSSLVNSHEHDME